MRIKAIFLSASILISFFGTFSISKTALASGEATTGTNIYSNVESVNSDCMTHEEHSALKVRIMKDQMAVASRNCDKSEKSLFAKIDKKFSKVFDSNNVVLEIFFNRFDANDPVKTMNNFITEIANMSSLKAIYNKKEFCENQNKMMESLFKIETKDVTTFADENIHQKISNPKVCDD